MPPHQHAWHLRETANFVSNTVNDPDHQFRNAPLDGSDCCSRTLAATHRFPIPVTRATAALRNLPLDRTRHSAFPVLGMLIVTVSNALVMQKRSAARAISCHLEWLETERNSHAMAAFWAAIALLGPNSSTVTRRIAGGKLLIIIRFMTYDAK